MALNINEVGTLPSPPPEAPKIYSEAYKHSIVDSVYQNENSFLSTVKGEPVLTEYYRHVTKAGEEIHPYQPGSGAYQSSTRIKNMVLKFIDESFSFDELKAQSSRTGSAYVIFGLTPIKGDAFIADIGDGNAGWYTVTAVTIKEFTANKVYQIEFFFNGILTNDVYNEFNASVIEELVYSRDQHLNGGTPIITQGEFDLKAKVFSWGSTIVRYMYETFYWEEERTLAYIQDSRYYYDPYVAKSFLTLVGTQTGSYPKVSLHSLEYSGNKAAQHGTYNIWDVLLRNDWNMLARCKPTAAIVDVKRIYSTRLHYNIRSSSFSGIIVTDPENYLDVSGWTRWLETVPLGNPIPNQRIATYLFSDDFYKGKPLPGFEQLVVDILKNNIVDLKKLNAYLETFWDLSIRQQFYYTPILLLMIMKSRKMGKII